MPPDGTIPSGSRAASAGDLTAAELGLEEARAARKADIGRERRKQDEIDIRSSQAGILERLLRGDEREIRSPDSILDVATLLDAGAVDDPLVRGIDLGRQFGIGQDPLRQI